MIHAIPVECGCFGMTSRWIFVGPPIISCFLVLLTRFFLCFTCFLLRIRMSGAIESSMHVFRHHHLRVVGYAISPDLFIGGFGNHLIVIYFIILPSTSWISCRWTPFFSSFFMVFGYVKTHRPIVVVTSFYFIVSSLDFGFVFFSFFI